MIVDRTYGEEDQFPAGMRVLAVDDDPICLKLLETLLRKCRYHVTTTSQSLMALKLLRENKDKFDLVISDVHMPDMDGFKLLELVGLEMDLPVIMLSANDDTKLVMKGITHGACDYLLKPVRMEELKNIWQHVIRRKKKVHPNGKNNCDESYNENESGKALAVSGDSDNNFKLNRKRKEQKEEDDEDQDNGLNNEDPSTQKKARLVWSGDLHRKFVAAVRTLGVDKAVPKKILDLMNVEKLTRENVASHLQKYRKYLYRISCVTSQQANMVASLGGLEAAYMRMNSLSGQGNIQNTNLLPFSSTGLVGGRINTPTGPPIYGFTSSGTCQLLNTQNLNNSLNIQPKFQPVIIPGNQNIDILQEMPTNSEFKPLKLENSGGNHSEPPPISSAISGNVNQLCGTIPMSDMDFPSDLPDFGRCTDSWKPNPFTPSENLRTTIPIDYEKIMFPTPMNSSSDPSINRNSNLRTDFIQKIRSEENSFSSYQNPNLACNSMNSMISSDGVLGSLTRYNGNFDNKNLGFNEINNFDEVGMQSPGDPQIIPQTAVEQSVLHQSAVKMGQSNPPDGYFYHNGGSLEDLVSAMRKLDQDMFM